MQQNYYSYLKGVLKQYPRLFVRTYSINVGKTAKADALRTKFKQIIATLTEGLSYYASACSSSQANTCINSYIGLLRSLNGT